MALPKYDLPTETFDLGGFKVEVRALSRAELIQAYNAVQAGDIDDGENVIVAFSTGVTVEEAAEWRNSTPAKIVGLLIDKINVLSGIDEGAEFQK